MNDAKVIVRRGDAVDEYPLPLPMVPTYREMNLIRRVTELTMRDILMGAGDDDDADFAVALYAIKRENPDFDVEAATRMFDLPRGSIEIHWGTPEPARTDPQAQSGSDDSETSGSAKPLTTSTEPSSDSPETSGIQE